MSNDVRVYTSFINFQTREVQLSHYNYNLSISLSISHFLFSSKESSLPSSFDIPRRVEHHVRAIICLVYLRKLIHLLMVETLFKKFRLF